MPRSEPFPQGSLLSRWYQWPGGASKPQYVHFSYTLKEVMTMAATATATSSNGNWNVKVTCQNQHETYKEAGKTSSAYPYVCGHCGLSV